ncbi:MAG: deoxyhypusine synthase [Candidatus Diapherotrites archaeon]|nr:deoxyhypusine synthase [Candidatus Diapherotrites archaeon]
MNPVKDIDATKKNTNELVNELYASGGFTAKKLGTAAVILEKMMKEKDCCRFISFPACVIATGTRGVIKDMVKEKRVDCIITTCGTMDHDLARVWKDYYHGTFLADDVQLHKKGINRLGNVFVPNDSYGIILEKRMQELLPKLYEQKKDWSTKELVWAFGESIKDEPKAEESIAYWAWKNQIPVFIPGPTDGAWGSNLWIFWQDHKDFVINLLRDEQDLSSIVWDAKKTGALMIGGGISKHHTIWWNQFRDGLDYAVQISTAVEWDGSLSGARVREAVSWGKVREDAEYEFVEGDATILLPLLWSAVRQKL